MKFVDLYLVKNLFLLQEKSSQKFEGKEVEEL